MTVRAKQMAAEGIDVISFAAGEPDFNTPDAIIEAAVTALRNGKTKYAPSAGIPELKQAVVEKLMRENKIAAKPNEIAVSCGAKHSLYNALQVLVQPGDEVILIAPYWMTYADQVILAGGEPVVVHTTIENGYVPTQEQIREKITSKTKAIIINSPSNPTGAAFDREKIKEIAALALRHNIWVISDEIYERLTYGFEHVSIAALGKDIAAQTITITGCSKSYSMTGWRIGFAHAPAHVIQAMSNLQDQVTSGATTFCQFGAIEAVNLPSEEIEAMRAEFDARRHLIVGRLNAIPGIRVHNPQGAFYAFPNVSNFLHGETKTDLALAEYLLDQAHIACIPGSVFEGPGHLRFSYAASREDIEKGMDRLEAALARLNS